MWPFDDRPATRAAAGCDNPRHAGEWNASSAQRPQRE
jgi:hypothetical protein